MSFCSSCGASAAPGARFCTACGRPVAPAGDESPATVAQSSAPEDAAPRSPARPSGFAAAASVASVSTSSPSGDTSAGERDAGAVIAGRYRVVGLLGRGGMGEVIRADDLTLGHPVALKFLPDAFQSSPGRRERFTSEVRVARQVAHPNVCRVYDIGTIDGRIFYTMEFVDGEDLASLLRRIGRLPQEMGIEIARQLCAGLAAIHDRGILHRDLKPANVMLEGRGRVRITDFGLSGEIDGIAAGEARAGTPAYMAPEQLEGREATVKSDIYSLGLMLYELFTGKRVFEAASIAELSRAHREGTPASPSTILPDFDPVIERVIERCLDREPSKRPPSAIAVAAALPGGDPVAAALAAGETPSPEMVAASGEAGGIHPALGLLCLAATLVGFVIQAGPAQSRRLLQYTPLEKPTAVLVERARSVLRTAQAGGGADHATGFDIDGALLASIAAKDSSMTRWDALRSARPAGIRFFYRESPDELIASAVDGVVTSTDPPMSRPGMTRVTLDPSGRLVAFLAIPPDSVVADSARASFDWNAFFAEAELDGARFAPASPHWVPPVYADARFAWTEGAGVPGARDSLRVEAASFEGRPVWFRVIGPWQRADRPGAAAGGDDDSIGQAFLLVLFLGMISISAFLAQRNLARGRGDRKGTARLVGLLFFGGMAGWLFTCSHTSDPGRIVDVLFPGIAMALFISLLIGAFYLAIEPYARRVWPERMISWTRLLLGRWRDPLVGRDVVVGGATFGAFALMGLIDPIVARSSGKPPEWPTAPYLRMFLGPGFVFDGAVNQIVNGILNGLFFFMLLFLFRLLVRRTWIASALLVLVLALLVSAESGFDAASALYGAVFGGVVVLVMLRFGVLALIVAWTFRQLSMSAAFTLDLSTWYAPISMFLLALGIGVTVFAFTNAVRGRSLLKDELLGG